MTRPLVLVTRPIEEAERTAAALAAQGCDALVDPLLLIEALPDAAAALGELDGVSALLFTSVNGVRAFAAASERRDLPVFAVGPTTAEAAGAAGFAWVATAGGDVESLVRLVLDQRHDSAEKLLHVAGEAVAGDLVGRLAAHGYDARRVALYRAVPATSLSDRTRDTLAHGRLAAALFFSPRTARTFVTLARTAGLEQGCLAAIAVCLSPAVAEAIGTLGWRQVAVARTPTLDAAIEALMSALPTGPGSDGRGANGQTERSTMAEDDPKTPDAAPAGDAVPAIAIAIGASEVIQRFGGIRPMAAKMGISFSTVQGWKERNQIPHNRHGEILALAEKLGVTLSPGAAPPTSPESAPPAPPEPTSPPVQAQAPPPPPPPPRATAMEQDKPPPLPPPLPPQAVPPEVRGLGVAGAALVSIAVVAVALAGAYYLRPYWQGAPASIAAPAPDSGALLQRVAKLEADLAARPAAQAPAADPKLAQDLSALARKATELEASLLKRAGDLDAALGASRREGQQAVAAAADQARALAARVEAVEKGFDPAAFVALRNGLNDLGGKIDALGKRIEQAEKSAAAARAQGLADAALALAVAQLRRAIDAGQAYSAELASCRALAGADAKVAAALDALAPMAATGVATRAALADAFPDTAGEISRAALERSETGWMRTVIDRLDALVTIRPVGASVTGETPRARAARAETLLAKNDLAGAVRALEGLEGRPAEAAKAWLARAKARVAAEAASAALEAQAMAHLAAKPGAAQ